MKRKILVALLFAGLSFVNSNASAHDFNNHATAKYLGNEAVLIDNGEHKLLFDPFFHNDYQSFQLVPQNIREAIFNNEQPYHNIDVIFISHAHGDHFDAKDTLRYLTRYKNTRLVAPEQAVKLLKALPDFTKIENQISAIRLEKDQAPKNFRVGNILIEAVRIPHSGWPQRADIENIVYRVGSEKTMNNVVRVMHFGDADANREHYLTHENFWEAKRSDIAFLPFWFALMPEGKFVTENILNVDTAIQVHVPKNVPPPLKASGAKYFSVVGEEVIIGKANEKIKQKN